MYAVYYKGESLQYQGYVDEIITKTKEGAIKIARKKLLPKSLTFDMDGYVAKKEIGKRVGKYEDVVPYEADGKLEAVEINLDNPYVYYSVRYCLYASRIDSQGRGIYGSATLLGTFYSCGRDSETTTRIMDYMGAKINPDAKNILPIPEGYHKEEMIARIKEYMRVKIKPDCERIFSITKEDFEKVFSEFDAKFDGKDDLDLPEYGLRFTLRDDDYGYIIGSPKPLE